MQPQTRIPGFGSGAAFFCRSQRSIGFMVLDSGQLCQGSTGSTPDDDGCLTAVRFRNILVIPTVVVGWDNDSRFRVYGIRSDV